MKALTPFNYEDLMNEKMASESQVIQIDKDVPRTKTVTKFLPELRNILIAWVNFSGKGYVQGMNLIAGCLLELLALQNDKEIDTIFEGVAE